jgi:hypothetical protein
MEPLYILHIHTIEKRPHPTKKKTFKIVSAIGKSPLPHSFQTLSHHPVYAL